MLNRLRSFFRTAAPSNGRQRAQRLAAVGAQVDDSPGWGSLTQRPHDYDPGRVQEIYADALEAWRKNPIAWRIIAITTDYTVGDALSLSSPNRSLNRFIRAFWSHPQNRMALRLESMSDELARAGDLFVLLFRNPQDGLSYIRFVTKDRIQHIETAPNDWEVALSYSEVMEGGETRVWLSPHHPQAGTSEAVMLHYAVNRPLGALLGESDLVTILPWLLRYSRMLEDRVRLHSALRAFYWDVTVPANTVAVKREQYRTPPEGGSILIHDESETWQAITPRVEAGDARHDLQAIRALIDAGSGYPPHWRGDASDISLATAQAMQGPAERHLSRRQRYFAYLLQDIVYQAYQRAAQVGAVPRLARADYQELFVLAATDVSRSDNESLARAARDLSLAYAQVATSLGRLPPELNRLMLRALFRFAGEPLPEETLETILRQVAEEPLSPQKERHVEAPVEGKNKPALQERRDDSEALPG